MSNVTSQVEFGLYLLTCMYCVASEAAEYCQFETFNATCPPDHVIIMEHAQYGRPRTGRCIARDYGYVGCSMSIVHLLDRICSGRRTCQLDVPSLRDIVQPCPRDLITYLDASYDCIIGMIRYTQPICRSILIFFDSFIERL